MSIDPFEPWNDPDATPLIRFENVTKRLGNFTVVDNLNLDIYEREFFALLGASGCGKTTLMRMLAGFERPTQGRITLDGVDLVDIPANKRPINMMFQSYALFPHLSVADNIAFGLKRSDMPASQIDGRVQEMLRLVQLSDLAKRKPHQISGGQRQRVALARALARAPKVLLLDEPLAALDKKLRQATQFELVDIQESTGTTFMIVTHDQEEAMTVATRIAVMDAGVIKQTATPDVIYERPNSAYVADFIGDVNLLDGKIQTSSAKTCTITWNGGTITTQPRTQLSIGRAVRFAIRPEKLSISTTEPSAGNKIHGKVLDIAYLGNISTYHVEIASGQIIKAQVANARRTAHRSFTWEDPVWLSWSKTAGIVLTE